MEKMPDFLALTESPIMYLPKLVNKINEVIEAINFFKQNQIDKDAYSANLKMIENQIEFTKEQMRLDEAYRKELSYLDLCSKKDIALTIRIQELEDENIKLKEENKIFKEEIEKLVSCVHNLNKIYGGVK